MIWAVIGLLILIPYVLWGCTMASKEEEYEQITWGDLSCGCPVQQAGTRCGINGEICTVERCPFVFWLNQQVEVLPD